MMPKRRAAAIVAGAVVGTAASVALSRRLIHRQRRRPDPERAERLTELPPEDLGPVVAPDGTLLAVRATGPAGAPALVFSHGFSLDMTTWHYQWRAFSERFRCVVYDQRGHGRSGAAENSDYSLQAMGGDVKAVLDAAVPDGPAVLIGHSMGGMAILAFAETHPEEFGDRVVGAVFADTAASELVRGALGGVVARLLALAKAPARADRVKRYMKMGESDLAFLVARLSNFGPKASPALVEHVAAVSGQAPVEVWTDGLAALLEMDLRHAIEHVAVPSLVIVGDLDRLTPPASAKRLADALPQGELVVLEGAGHMAPMERYTQFNRELGRFAAEAFGRRPAAVGAGRAQGAPHNESTGRPGLAPGRRARTR
jgi:pimeloyl-ACP methyl ester carboxylesterase